MQQQLARLGKNILTYGVGHVLVRMLSFLLLPLFTAYLTPTDYGISSILGLVTFVLTPIFSLGLGVSMSICYFEEKDVTHRSATVWTAVLILLISATLLMVVSTLFAPQISQLAFQSPAYVYLVMIAGGTTGLSILTTPFMFYLQFEERIKTYVSVTVTSLLISIGLNVLMVVGLRRGVAGLVESQLLGQAVTLVLFLAVSAYQIKWQINWKIGRELLQHGIPFIPSFAFLFVIQQSNKYILQWHAGLDTVGIYTIGFNIGMILAIFVNVLSNAWTPYFMSFVDQQDQARQLFGKITSYYILGVGGITLAFFIAARPLLLILTQPAFHDAYRVVGLSASSQFFNGLYSLLLPGIYFAKEVKFVSFVQSAAAVIAFIGNLLLIMLFGMFGAALGLAFGIFAMVAIQYLWNRLRGYLDVHYELDRIGRFTLLALGVAGLSLWPRNFTLVGEAVGATILALVVLITIYMLLTPDEKTFLWASARRVGMPIPQHLTSKL